MSHTRHLRSQRKAQMLGEMEQRVANLRASNAAMRRFLASSGSEAAWKAWSAANFPDVAEASALPADVSVRLRSCRSGEVPDEGEAGREDHVTLHSADFALMQAVERSARNFLITDPTVPDNPIVFASDGFYAMTGHRPTEVIGRNCRFLQGPDTDPDVVREIRGAVHAGKEIHCVLLNYRADGRPFWNELFIAPLRGPSGAVVHFLGVQSQITEAQAKAFLRIRALAAPAAAAAAAAAVAAPAARPA
jgi:PAS domain S-box-containing protein